MTCALSCVSSEVPEVPEVPEAQMHFHFHLQSSGTLSRGMIPHKRKQGARLLICRLKVSLYVMWFVRKRMTYAQTSPLSQVVKNSLLLYTYAPTHTQRFGSG